MSDPVIWISNEDVSRLVSLEDAIEALAVGLGMQGRGEAKNVTKALGTWGDGSSMHALGSMFPADGYVGFKTWANTKQGAYALFELFDSNTGQLLACIESQLLGPLRTSSISGLATRHLARPDADEMALIGTGHGALLQVIAVAAVRPLKRLRVFSPTPANRRAFVADAAAQFGFDVVEAGNVREATQGASIVTVMTRAREPFFRAADLDAGAHFNAVGAILPAFGEFTDDVFDRTGIVVVDSLDNAKLASYEFRKHYGADGGPAWNAVKELCELVVAGTTRPAGADVTLFKSLGMGISDLSVAKMVYERAKAQGIGREIPPPARAKPRWNAGRKKAAV